MAATTGLRVSRTGLEWSIAGAGDHGGVDNGPQPLQPATVDALRIGTVEGQAGEELGRHATALQEL